MADKVRSNLTLGTLINRTLDVFYLFVFWMVFHLTTSLKLSYSVPDVLRQLLISDLRTQLLVH